jgi:hypothetical protein
VLGHQLARLDKFRKSNQSLYAALQLALFPHLCSPTCVPPRPFSSLTAAPSPQTMGGAARSDLPMLPMPAARPPLGVPPLGGRGGDSSWSNKSRPPAAGISLKMVQLNAI